MTTNKRNGNTWAKVLMGVVGAAAAIWIILTSLGASATGQWQAYAASLRAKGQPITFAEIEAQRAIVPEGQNSARIIEGLAVALAEHRDPLTIDGATSGSNEAGDFFTGIKRGRIEPAREFLSKHQDILTKLTEMRDKPTGRFTIQYDQKNPLATLVPSAAQVRTASKLVRLDTKLRLIDGDQAGALRGFELQCRLAGAFGDEPTLISRLVQIAIQAMAIQTAEDMLRTGALDDASLERMTAELNSMKQSGTLKWALLGERAFFVEACDAMAAGRISFMDVATSAEGRTVPFLRLPAFLMRSNQLCGTQMHTSLIDVVGDPKALMAAANKIEQDVPNLPRTQMVVKVLLPSLTRAIFLDTRLSAQLDCAIAAIAAERFRLAEGRLPTTLDQLVTAYLPTLPIDPFDGKPLKLARTDQGIIIYSVDENGTDDGGDITSRKVGVRTITSDKGFRLHDVDHRGVLIVEDSAPSDE